MITVDCGAAISFINQEFLDDDITRNIDQNIADSLRSPYDPNFRRSCSSVESTCPTTRECIQDNFEGGIFNQASPRPIPNSSTTDTFEHNHRSAEGNDGRSHLPSSPSGPSCTQFIGNYISTQGSGITNYVMSNNKLTYIIWSHH